MEVVIALILAQVMPVDFLSILVPPLVTVYQRQFMTGEPHVLSLPSPWLWAGLHY